jgi:predicted AlkP superfamily pyrophosphatase or phosphodiesterase
MFTGVWAKQHGIFQNGRTLNPKVRTILYQLCEQGKKTTFSFSWAPHLTASYKLEAQTYPNAFLLCKDDAGTEASMTKALEAGDDAVFGILEATDHAGHSKGYGLRNPIYMKALQRSEAAANRLIAVARGRELEHNEDWLIIITTDHGGLGFDHKGPTLPEIITFFASNKEIF